MWVYLYSTIWHTQNQHTATTVVPTFKSGIRQFHSIEETGEEMLLHRLVEEESVEESCFLIEWLASNPIDIACQ